MAPTCDMNPIAIRKMEEERMEALEKAAPLLSRVLARSGALRTAAIGMLGAIRAARPGRPGAAARDTPDPAAGGRGAAKGPAPE